MQATRPYRITSTLRAYVHPTVSQRKLLHTNTTTTTTNIPSPNDHSFWSNINHQQQYIRNLEKEIGLGEDVHEKEKWYKAKVTLITTITILLIVNQSDRLFSASLFFLLVLKIPIYLDRRSYLETHWFQSGDIAIRLLPVEFVGSALPFYSLATLAICSSSSQTSLGRRFLSAQKNSKSPLP